MRFTKHKIHHTKTKTSMKRSLLNTKLVLVLVFFKIRLIFLIQCLQKIKASYSIASHNATCKHIFDCDCCVLTSNFWDVAAYRWASPLRSMCCVCQIKINQWKQIEFGVSLNLPYGWQIVFFKNVPSLLLANAIVSMYNCHSTRRCVFGQV